MNYEITRKGEPEKGMEKVSDKQNQAGTSSRSLTSKMCAKKQRFFNTEETESSEIKKLKKFLIIAFSVCSVFFY